jgi:hypothetical protein
MEMVLVTGLKTCCCRQKLASYVKTVDHCIPDGFSICSSCKSALIKGNMPKFAIAHHYCFSLPPACILALTDVEVAFLTPVKTHGYCFSYTGGIGKNLKGTLSYYKVNAKSIA